MGQSEKKLLGIAAALIVAWAVLFYMFIYPMWTQRETTLAAAKQQLEQLDKLTKDAQGTWAVPAAEASLDAEAAAIQTTLMDLRAVESGDLGVYKKSAIKDGDPNTYFALQRTNLIRKVRAEGPALAQAIADDLGFRDKASQDPAELNLVRLFVLSKFFEAAKAAGVEGISKLQYPEPAVMERPEGLEIENLIQVPLVVQLQISEPLLGPLIYQLEPNPKHKTADRYFCVRALQVSVKNDKSGVLDVLVNVGALFTQTQMKDQGVTVKSEQRGGFTPFQPFQNPKEY